MRPFDRVDDLLHPRALREVALIRLTALGNLLGEVVDEVRVEERAPRLPLLVPDREVRGRDLDLDEFHRIWRGALEHLTLAELLNEPADERALRAVDARFDPGVVPDRHVGGLHRADGAVFVFADVDIAVVDVRADPAAIRVLALRDEVL